MNAALIGFLTFVFIGMTLLNRIIEGNFILSSDLTIVNQLTVFKNLEIFGFISVPVPNLEFITTGLPHLMKFDYSFFGGAGGFFQYFLYGLTAAVAFGLFLYIVGNLISSYLIRRS